MKFRNITADDLFVPSLGVYVAAGDTTPDLDDEAAAGYVLQTAVWSAVGAEAKAVQKSVVNETINTEEAE